MPGIVRRAVIVIEPGCAIGKLHRVGFAHENHAGGSKLAHDGAILSGDVVRQQMRAGSRGHAFHIEQILRGVRNAMQDAHVRAALQCTLGGTRLREGPFRHDADK